MANRFRTAVLLLSGTPVTANSTTIFVNGAAVQPGGNVAGLATSGNLEATGTVLQNQITNALSTKVTGVSISGGIAITGALNISAGTNVTLSQAGLNSFSIAATAGSTNINGLISTGDADSRYLASGASGQFYLKSNPNNFSTSGNVENTGTNVINLIRPTWTNLTWGPTTTWSAQQNVSEDRKIIALTGSTTLSITNLYNGWAGVLKAVQSGNSYTTGHLITLPAGAKVINSGLGSVVANLSTGISGAIDVLGFEYDGTHLLVGIGSKFN